MRQRVDDFRASLTPLRQTLSAQPFVGGARPLYADYIIFGGFQWAHSISDLQALADDGPINDWFQRCQDGIKP